MFFKQIKDQEGCMSYIFACKHTGEAAIVDPNHDLETYLTILNNNNLKLLYVIDTHTHADHDSLAGILSERTGARVVMHENYGVQREAGEGFSKHSGVAAHLKNNANIKVDLSLEDGSRLKIGHIEAQIFHTPGHTSDAMCILLQKQRIILTGDTLMIGQCGRTDLPKRVEEIGLPLDKPIVTVCESAVRSAYAAMFLRGYGYSHVKTLEHGMYTWRAEGMPLVSGQ